MNELKPTPQKSLLPSSFAEFPAILPHYLSANEEVFNRHVGIPPKDYNRLLTLQDELREHGIDYKDYAYTVVRLYGAWCKKWNRRQVPLSIFCGSRALQRYMKVAAKASVEMRPTGDGKLLYSEMLVAHTYINWSLEGKWQPIRNVMDEVLVMLDRQWIVMFHEHKRGELVDKALELLCKEYGVKDALDYDDLVRQCKQTH
jgi:hypothetical protein